MRRALFFLLGSLDVGTNQGINAVLTCGSAELCWDLTTDTGGK